MMCSKGQNYGMALKIDLEQTYDRIMWDFLEDTFLEVGPT